MSPEIELFLGSVIRHFLTVIVGALGLDAVVTDEWYKAIVAASLLTIALVWSWIQKRYFANLIVQTKAPPEPLR